MRPTVREASAAATQGRRTMKRLGSAAWSGNVRDDTNASVLAEDHLP
jgi:hypothetical protein